MDCQTYRRLYPKIHQGADLEKLSADYGLPKRALEMILLQKTVRGTMRSHWRVKADAKKMLKKWEVGESFLKLAKEADFPPVMMASIIMQERGVSRKQFTKMAREPHLVRDARMRRDLEAALEKDDVYSPRGAEDMSRRGKKVEARVGEWLTAHSAHYHTEKDSQKLGRPKTPDFLLSKPFDIGGFKVNWFECKASFGDDIEYRRDYKKQFSHYVKLFGPGLVVYWYGFLSDLRTEDVVLASGVFFKSRS
jgi:hypothetical protein